MSVLEHCYRSYTLFNGKSYFPEEITKSSRSLTYSWFGHGAMLYAKTNMKFNMTEVL